MGKARKVSAPAWSNWEALAPGSVVTGGVLGEILDGGQAFRWYRVESDVWAGTFGTHVVRLTLDPQGTLLGSTPGPLTSAFRAAFDQYWPGGHALAPLVDAMPWRSDPHLTRCLAALPGLRILRQPFGETLLAFLCSATKQIVQIKQMVALLAERHGTPILDSRPPHDPPLPAALRFRLPTWTELAAVPEAELRQCQLGFRARYIHQTARFLVAHPGWLEETEAMPYHSAKERLCTLPGVGEKVADCVLLFGAGRLEAFPVDTWILKAMAARYALHGWKPAQVAQFGRAHFGASAGLAQQYLFSWERKFARTAAA